VAGPGRPAPFGAGSGYLLVSLFVANLLPCCLEAAGYGLAALGTFYLVYLGGTAERCWPDGSPACAALGAPAAGCCCWRLWGLLTAAALLIDFTLLLAGAFGLHALAEVAAGRWGAGVGGAYVSAYYLGGALADWVYPFFLDRGMPGR